MSRANGRWFRFYEATVNNPKAQRLPGELFKFWVNCLCLASARDGALPPAPDVAFALRLPERKASENLAALVAARLLECADDGVYRPHDWREHQYPSDSSAERVKRHRERRRGVTGNGDVTLQAPSLQRYSNGTDTDTDTDTEVEIESKSSLTPDGVPWEVPSEEPTQPPAPLTLLPVPDPPNVPATSQEVDLFRRGKEVLGVKGGGLVAKVLKLHKGNVALARSSIELASTKENPREWIGGLLRKGSNEEADREAARRARHTFN